MSENLGTKLRLGQSVRRHSGATTVRKRHGVRAIAALSATLAFGGQAAQADPVSWEKLAQHPGALSAISTAIAMSGACKVPFTFDQRRDGETLIVSVTCANTADGAGTINVKFEALGKRLIVTGFEFDG